MERPRKGHTPAGRPADAAWRARRLGQRVAGLERGLDSWQLAHAGYRQDHAQLLRELYAVYRTRMGRSAYYYGYGTEKTIDLSECESPQLWAVLTEAGRKGLQLIHANPALGDVECRGHGEVVLDVTADGGRGSQVAAVLRLDGEPAAELQPLLFAGSTGHGVICAERADIEAGHPSDDWRLRLVGLLTPARPRSSDCCWPANSSMSPRGYGPLRPGVVPGTVPSRAGCLLRRVVYPAGGVRAQTCAGCGPPFRLHGRGQLGMGLPSRRGHAAGAAPGQWLRPCLP